MLPPKFLLASRLLGMILLSRTKYPKYFRDIIQPTSKVWLVKASCCRITWTSIVINYDIMQWFNSCFWKDFWQTCTQKRYLTQLEQIQKFYSHPHKRYLKIVFGKESQDMIGSWLASFRLWLSKAGIWIFTLMSIRTALTLNIMASIGPTMVYNPPVW